MSKRFGITGVAGYIAPRHLRAIKDTGNNLIAALDPHDAVGVLDAYFPNADFFTETERFDRHLEKLKRVGDGKGIDYLSICSPNYLHDSHIRMALRLGANAICEKPLVLNPWNLDLLEEIETESQRKIFTVLQLRLHPSILVLKKGQINLKKKAVVELTYITSRGNWYSYSWKGDLERSGGIASNIGIHFFDVLLWIYGDVQNSELHFSSHSTMSGFLELEHATINWFLSIDGDSLPTECLQKGQRTFRCINVDGKELEFSDGFTDLHTMVYEDVLSGNGFGVNDARPSVILAHAIRSMAVNKSAATSIHPFLK